MTQFARYKDHSGGKFVGKDVELTRGTSELVGPRGMRGGGRWRDECGAQETCKTFKMDLEAILKAVGVAGCEQKEPAWTSPREQGWQGGSSHRGGRQTRIFYQ